MRTSHPLLGTQVSGSPYSAFLFLIECGFSSARYVLRFCSICWHSDPGKEINCRFVIDPSVDFGFVNPVQLPNLIFDLFDIDSHSYYIAHIRHIYRYIR